MDFPLKLLTDQIGEQEVAVRIALIQLETTMHLVTKLYAVLVNYNFIIDKTTPAYLALYLILPYYTGTQKSIA